MQVKASTTILKLARKTWLMNHEWFVDEYKPDKDPDYIKVALSSTPNYSSTVIPTSPSSRLSQASAHKWELGCRDQEGLHTQASPGFQRQKLRRAAMAKAAAARQEAEAGRRGSVLSSASSSDSLSRRGSVLEGGEDELELGDEAENTVHR